MRGPREPLTPDQLKQDLQKLLRDWREFADEAASGGSVGSINVPAVVDGVTDDIEDAIDSVDRGRLKAAARVLNMSFETVKDDIVPAYKQARKTDLKRRANKLRARIASMRDWIRNTEIQQDSNDLNARIDQFINESERFVSTDLHEGEKLPRVRFEAVVEKDPGSTDRIGRLLADKLRSTLEGRRGRGFEELAVHEKIDDTIEISGVLRIDASVANKRELAELLKAKINIIASREKWGPSKPGWSFASSVTVKSVDLLDESRPRRGNLHENNRVEQMARNISMKLGEKGFLVDTSVSWDGWEATKDFAKSGAEMKITYHADQRKQVTIYTDKRKEAEFALPEDYDGFWDYLNQFMRG